MKTRGATMKKMFVCLFTSFYALFSAFGGIPIKAQEQDPPTAIEFTQESIDQLEYEMGEDSPYAGEYLTYTVDEENNIEWSRRLEDAGCRIIYGIDHIKVHYRKCSCRLFVSHNYGRCSYSSFWESWSLVGSTGYSKCVTQKIHRKNIYQL